MRQILTFTDTLGTLAQQISDGHLPNSAGEQQSEVGHLLQSRGRQLQQSTGGQIQQSLGGQLQLIVRLENYSKVRVDNSNTPLHFDVT